jgi:DnaJ domain
VIPISDCYTILELPKNATEKQVRSSFRKLALQWHPDRNKAPEATEKFVRIHEAYNTLIQHLASHKQAWTKRKPVVPEPESRESIIERARQNARMRYEEYLNSDQYQQDLTHESFNDLFGFVLSLLCAIGLPWLILGLFGRPGLPAAIALFVITAMAWVPGLRNIKDVDFSRLKGGLMPFYAESLLAQVIVFGLSISWLGLISFRMMLRPTIMIGLFVLVLIGSFLFIRLKKIHVANSWLTTLSLASIIIAGLFTLNCIFGYNLRTETYLFKMSGEFQTYTQTTRLTPYHTGEKTTYTENWPTITLQNQQYDAFPQIRFCLEPNEVNGTTVTYVIGTGILGIDYVSKKHLGPDSLEIGY